jgi:outer membrane receptor protein involved in Fe transport
MESIEARSLRSSALSTTGVVALAVAMVGLAAPAAWAQGEGEAAESGDRVVVTGSRIQRQDYTANSPIVTVDADTFENTSTLGIETVLNQLPQFVPAATEFTSTTLGATATTTPGASTVNLRGLGSWRTLTLIDGRRGMPTNATLAVDTNMIPSSAIERVEIISGGASAVYGADAVAGVVNFILKDDFEGVDVTTRYGMTEEGDGEQFQISGLIGSTVANGRGNVMLGAEHSSRSPALDIEREWAEETLADPFYTGTEPSPLPETYVQFATNQPSQARINTIFGDSPNTCILPGTGAPCSMPSRGAGFFVNPSLNGNGTLFVNQALFQAATGTRASGSQYTGELLADDGFPYRKIRADGLVVENDREALTSLPLERYSAFGKAEFGIADNVDLFLQGNFAHTESRTKTAYSPAVGNWVTTIPYGDGDIYADSFLDPDSAVLGFTPDGQPIWDPNAPTNPDFLPGGRYGLGVQQGNPAIGAPDLTCGPTGGCTESYVFPMPSELRGLLNSRTDPGEDVRVNRTMDYLPRRETVNRVNTYQLIFGLQGTFWSDWVWDASVSHGQSETLTLYNGSSSMAQYKAVAESPNFGVDFFEQGFSPTSSGTGECTTGLPLFRDFVPSQDCIDTISADLQFTSQMTMNVAEANAAGDLFDLPAGAVGASMGAAWREFEYEANIDEMNHGKTFADQVIGQFPQEGTNGQIGVFEVYGELLVPILSDLPFIQQFNLEIGGRLSDYDTTGMVETYKILGDWTVTDWMRLRGGYNLATRAPHIGELYVGRTNNGAPGTLNDGDPCSQNNNLPTYGAGAGNPDAGNRAAVQQLCRDMMTGTGEFNFYDSRPLSEQPTRPGGGVAARATSGVLYGNLDIEPETANTWTAGAVFTSPVSNPWLDGLSLAVDYYSIEVEDIIARQSATELWRDCILSLDADSAACSVVHRDPTDGGANIVDITYTNAGYAKFTGVDLQVNWSAQFEDIGLGFVPGGLAINSQLTVPIDRITQATPTADKVENVGTLRCDLDLNCSGYDYSLFTTFNYFVGDLSLSLRWNNYPSIEAVNYATDPETRDRGTFTSYNVFSLSGSYQLNDTMTLRAGVDNILDNPPPFSGGSFAEDGGFTTTPPPSFPTMPSRSGAAQYDQLGRRFFVGATASF